MAGMSRDALGNEEDRLTALQQVSQHGHEISRVQPLFGVEHAAQIHVCTHQQSAQPERADCRATLTRVSERKAVRGAAER
jgi:transposase-like protein